MKTFNRFLMIFVISITLIFSFVCCKDPETPNYTNHDDESDIIVPEMVLVKGSTITGAEYPTDEGVFIEGRTVTLTDFYIGKYEVTQEEYASVMKDQKIKVGETEYTLKSNPSFCQKDSTEYTLFSNEAQEKRPVEGVTWYDVIWYCNSLSENEGLNKAYNIDVTTVSSEGNIKSATVTLNKDANGYRLPTEAEWEYAARGGDTNQPDWDYTFSGSDTAEGVELNSEIDSGLDSVGWYCFNNITGQSSDEDATSDVSGCGTHQVGKKFPNRLGLYDMSGNVWEWCYDWYGTINSETSIEGADDGTTRLYRGGSWWNVANQASVSKRGVSYNVSSTNNDLGFRIVRPVK